jgi:hypothetical protein
MRTKNAKAITKAEHQYIAIVKNLQCSVCDDPGPCDAHHVKQGQHFTVIALCKSCHQGPLLGWHGQRRMWAIKRMDELDALAVTFQRVTVVLMLQNTCTRSLNVSQSSLADATSANRAPG